MPPPRADDSRSWLTRRDVLAATLACLLPSGTALAAPIFIRDAAGRTVTLPAPARRIVTIFASNTELVAALGLLDRVVGIDALTTYPPEVSRIRQVGGRLGFSVDAIIEQAPDLLLVTPARNAMHQLLDPMTRIGVPVIVLMSRNVREVMANIRLVGVACGEPVRGESVARALEARLAATQARAAGRPRPRVLLITGRVSNGLLLVAQPKTYTGDAIVLAGGTHAIAPSVTGQVSPEAVWSSDPDLLLYAGPQPALDELTAQPRWRQLRAVQRGQAHIVPRGELLIPGPRTVDGIERVARLIEAAA